MRKALVIGINYYENCSSLFGCVADASAVCSVIERNGDGSINFDVRLLAGSSRANAVRRSELREAIQQLFQGDCEIAFLYFAGHGHVESTGGYLIASDVATADLGIPLIDILTYANKSRATNRVIVLDSCHAGIAGNGVSTPSFAELKEGTTILTASTAEQYADEKNGRGVFTTLFVDALSGAAGNLVGDVTPGSVYAHIDQSLGTWDQRPVFKTNVKSFVSLRKVKPPISLGELQRLTEFFPKLDSEYQLDPAFEPDRAPPR